MQGDDYDYVSLWRGNIHSTDFKVWNGELADCYGGQLNADWQSAAKRFHVAASGGSDHSSKAVDVLSAGECSWH